MIRIIFTLWTGFILAAFPAKAASKSKNTWPVPVAALTERWNLQTPIAADRWGTHADGSRFLVFRLDLPADSYGQVLLKSSNPLVSVSLHNQKKKLIVSRPQKPGSRQTETWISHYSKQSISLFAVLTFSSYPAQLAGDIAWRVHRNDRNRRAFDRQSALEGLLTPSDRLTEDRRPYDDYLISQASEPIAYWVDAPSLDTDLLVLDADGRIVASNRDAGLIAAQFAPRVVVPGSEEGVLRGPLTLRVSADSLGEAAWVIPGYRVFRLPLEQAAKRTTRHLRIRFIDATPDVQTHSQRDASLRREQAVALKIWQNCQLSLTFDPVVVEKSLLSSPGTLHAGEHAWTEGEEKLFHSLAPYRRGEDEVLVALVDSIDDGKREGLSYPVSRFSPDKANVIVLAKRSLLEPRESGTLAHELGHILGLDHQDLLGESGDMRINEPSNLMFSKVVMTKKQEKVMRSMLRKGSPQSMPWIETGTSVLKTVQPLQDQLTRMQCAIAYHSSVFGASSSSTEHPAYIFDANRILGTGRRHLRLSLASPRLDDTRHVEVYYLRGGAERSYKVCVNGKDFDPFLFVQNARGETIAENDDRDLQTHDACVAVSVPANEPYVSLGITSAEDEGYGEFTVDVQE